MPRQRLLELRLPPCPHSLHSMRAELARVLDGVKCRDQEAQRLVLAVNEAVMNVIQHGYCDGSGSEITVEVLYDGGNLVFRVTDSAKTVDPTTIQPRALDDVRPGGLGIHFIREIMDEVIFSVPETGVGNRLTMIKRCARSAKSAF